MKSILKLAFIGLLAISTTAYAGKHKKKQKAVHTSSMHCPSSCPRTGSCHWS